MRWRKLLYETGTPGHFFARPGLFRCASTSWYSEWVSEHSVFPENEVTQKIEFIQIMHITQVRQECNIGPLGQYSLVSCGEIALKSSNIQSPKNNKICDLKYNLDFSIHWKRYQCPKYTKIILIHRAYIYPMTQLTYRDCTQCNYRKKSKWSK